VGWFELEAAPKGSDLLACLTVILIVTIFHELIHHLTKVTYGSKVTPAGCDGYSVVFGESDKDLGILLLGGVAIGMWKTEHLGEMEKIQLLLLVYHKQDQILPAEMFPLMINTFTTLEFETTLISSLQTYIQKKE
jgi:hypothetical protein